MAKRSVAVNVLDTVVVRVKVPMTKGKGVVLNLFKVTDKGTLELVSANLVKK